MVREAHCWPAGQAPRSRSSQSPFELHASHKPLQLESQHTRAPPTVGLQKPEVHSLLAPQGVPSPTLGSRQFPAPSQLPRTPGATFSQSVPAFAKRGRHSC